TRLIAIVPAMVVIYWVGEDSMMKLLIFSQVVLSFQLPFAVVPLLHFTSDKKRMGAFANPPWVRFLGWSAASIIIALNAYLVKDQVGKRIEELGDNAIWLEATVVPLAGGCGLLLLWLIVRPWVIAQPQSPAIVSDARATAIEVAHGLTGPLYRRIGVALDNSAR